MSRSFGVKILLGRYESNGLQKKFRSSYTLGFMDKLGSLVQHFVRPPVTGRIL